MTSTRTLADLTLIASWGGGLDIDASTFTTAELVSLAATFRSTDALLILRNVSGFATSDLGTIAATSAANVIFVDP